MLIILALGKETNMPLNPERTAEKAVRKLHTESRIRRKKNFYMPTHKPRDTLTTCPSSVEDVLVRQHIGDLQRGAGDVAP